MKQKFIRVVPEFGSGSGRNPALAEILPDWSQICDVFLCRLESGKSDILQRYLATPLNIFQGLPTCRENRQMGDF